MSAIADTTGLLDSLVRNVPGAIYRCALDESWTMQLIGDALQGLADRVAAMGGRLAVESPPGAGTVLRADVPLTGRRD